MNPNRYYKDNDRAHRQELVADAALSGMSTREIAEYLRNPPKLPNGALAFKPIEITHVTVAEDLKELKAAWREAASQTIAEHQANQYAEIQRAKRRCWAKDDMGALARFMRLETDILGTNAPIKIDVVARDQAIDGLLDLLSKGNRGLYDQLTEWLAGLDPTALGTQGASSTHTA